MDKIKVRSGPHSGIITLPEVYMDIQVRKAVSYIFGKERPIHRANRHNCISYQTQSLKISFFKMEYPIQEQSTLGQSFIYLAEFSDDASQPELERFLLVVNSFTRSDWKEIKKLNPALIKARQNLKQPSSISKISLVFRDHMLLEKLNIIMSLLHCGLPISECIVIPKPDTPQNKHRIISTLSLLGIDVFVNKDCFEQAGRWASERNRPIIVLDDGGDFIHHCMKNLPQEKVWHGIETTTKGARLLKKSQSSKYTDISSTPIKKNKSLEIAVSCVTAFRNLNRHRKLIGEKILLVGYGSLGHHIARIMKSMGIIIVVIETDKERTESANNDGFVCFSSIEEAAREFKSFNYLIGCSGTQCVNYSHLCYFEKETVLGSVSSQDLCLLRVYLEENAKHKTTFNTETCYSMDGKNITILADGHAINIHNSEGVPELEFDDVTTEIFQTICDTAEQLAR